MSKKPEYKGRARIYVGDSEFGTLEDIGTCGSAKMEFTVKKRDDEAYRSMQFIAYSLVALFVVIAATIALLAF